MPTPRDGKGERRDPAEHQLKQDDQAMDATRYALHTELSRIGSTGAYLAELRCWVELRTPLHSDSFI
jgi:hypothetical protein